MRDLFGKHTARLAVSLGLVALVGCSAFRSTRRLNLAPFAEDMIALAGDIQYGLGQTYPVYLRGYGATPEGEQLKVMSTKVRAIIRGAISYAVEVVSLADSRMSGSERSRALGNYLDGLLRPVLAAPRPPLNLSVAQLDTIVTDVRAQDDLLDALNAAQPIINEIARVSGEVFDDAKRALDDASEGTQRRISEQVGPVLEADRLLRAAQIETTFNIRFLRNHRSGDATAIDSLLLAEPSLAEVVSKADGVSPAELRAIEERLLFKLRALREVRDQLRPDIELYWKQQAELEELVNVYNAALRQARVAIVAWSRAHQRMAAGIVDPAQIDIFGIAKKAAGTVSPLP